MLSSFNEIVTDTNIIVDKMSSMSKLIIKINEHKDRTRQAIINISSVSQETAAAAEEVTTTSQEQSAISEEVNQLAIELRGLADKLFETINKFQI